MDSAIASQFPTNGTTHGSALNGSHPKASPKVTNGTIAGLLSRQNNDGTRGGLFGDDDDDDTASADQASSVASPSSVTSPPYWMNHHQRSVSNVSVESVLPAGAITMHDNEASDRNDRNRACWAKSVEITDYVIVNGSTTNIGAFVVWNIRVETLQGSYMNIRKRYSEFDDLREKLIKSFPNFEAAVPPLPPKSVISKFRPRFLDKRRSGLQYFLNCIMLNPEFSGSPVLKDFLFS
ncbi:PX domain-containing protein [Colletotrichum karsti]|uniref:Endosomal/vacuolar adapter protein YPT35 n=1 Tax=Colletotrichum karsti TaxID=1095194 RepID=A0A9P6I3T2_9PEZI|nr:PX domain-containing protein [Colletotrichum karsti]KAF9875719.1 PX domain-containing protein [Colletotrichum karsti]